MPDRAAQLHSLSEAPLDVLILGGGINGAGVLRDLALRSRTAGRPLRLGLVEKGHFASGTSGKNSQLIHGGLRYLKNLEFRLVREALRERDTLLRIAPHLVEPQPFLIPFYGWMGRAFYGTGLVLYDLLASGHRIASHRRLGRREALTLEPGLRAEGLVGAAVFQDCRVHSARLVLENVLEAVHHGAFAANYVHADEPRRVPGGLWEVAVQDQLSGASLSVQARCIVNARGAWNSGQSLRLVRGSHLIVPRLNHSGNAISYFEENGRIIFFIPWGEDLSLTLVGTTDVDHPGSPDDVNISRAEVEYLLRIVHDVFPNAGAITPLSAYSSLRPLVRDEAASATKTSREHRIWRDEQGIVQIAGGKYTTYRLMSEEAADLTLEDVAPELNGLRLTASTPLNGNSRERLVGLQQQMAGAAQDAQRMLKQYGTATPQVLALIAEEGSLQAARVRYAAEHELACRLTDLLFVSTYWGYERTWSIEQLYALARQMGRWRQWTETQAEAEASRAAAQLQVAIAAN